MANETITLPEPDDHGVYKWSDGAMIAPQAAYCWAARVPGKGPPCWLPGDGVHTKTFGSIQDAARALQALGYGPGAKPADAPKLPAGYDAAKIPPHLEWKGEMRKPRRGEWFLKLYCPAGPDQATCDFISDERPILVPKAGQPAAPKPTPAATPQPKETPMPETTPQGEPLSKEDREFLVSLARDYHGAKRDGPAGAAAFVALAAECRRLQRRCEPVPPALSAYVAAEPIKRERMEPIPSVISRVLAAAGVALLTALATIAGVAGGGLLLASKFHLLK